MPYAAEISRSNPSCFLFLIDQSKSMLRPVAGGQGKGPNQLDLPLGLTVADNAVYVADSNNHRIAVFAPLP